MHCGLKNRRSGLQPAIRCAITATEGHYPKAGRAAAVARGVKLGRKPKLSPQQIAHARKLLEQGEHPDDVARLLMVSRRTVERALKN
jgi:Helix-turn-helix domain of resolvase